MRKLLGDNAITELVQWALNKFSLLKHTHEASEVTGLETNLSNKADKEHTHAQSDITGLSTTLAGKANTGDLTAHTGNTSNPHSVTKAQIGLENVGNFKAVSTVAGQGLTESEKANARTNIGAGASSFSGNYNDLANKPTIPTKTSQLENDSGFITEGSGTQITIDTALSATSVNPVQNKVVKAALDKKANTTDIPTSLPANGGNAATVNGLTVQTAVPANAKFTDTTYGVVSTSANGLCPKRGGTTTKFLRDDGTWAVPPDTNTVYTHPTTAGNKHIPAGGASGQYLKWSAAGTAVWATIATGATVITGTYSGAGANISTLVDIGVEPKAVIVTPVSINDDYTVSAIKGTAVGMPGYNTAALSLTTNGFYVGAKINATGTKYVYIALV